MTGSTPPPIPAAREAKAPLQPSFLRALRGIWLFTWKSQLTWRRLPIEMFSLLALPLLVCLTTSSPRVWSQRHSLLGDPAGQLDGFSRRLNRAAIPLEPEKRAELQRIMTEEYEDAERDWGETPAPEISVNSQSERIKACHERIRNRAETVLNARQLAQFKTFDQKRLEESLGRVKEPKWGRAGPFYHWLIDFYFFVILPLNCARACGALIREELQADTLGFLTTRPLSRARLLATKYLSQTAWLQIVALVQALLLFAAGNLRQIPALSVLLPLFLVTQFLAVLAWSALGAFLGQLTKRYMAMALVYGLVVEMGIGSIPTNINTLSLMRHLKSLLAYNPALQSIYESAGKGAFLSVGALALATGLFLTLAAVLFTFKEYHSTAEMQK